MWASHSSVVRRLVLSGVTIHTIIGVAARRRKNGGTITHIYMYIWESVPQVLTFLSTRTQKHPSPRQDIHYSECSPDRHSPSRSKSHSGYATGVTIPGRIAGDVARDGRSAINPKSLDRRSTRNHSIRRPDIARKMTSCLICSVPSKMSWLTFTGLVNAAQCC
jgi:hypothetical protein